MIAVKECKTTASRTTVLCHVKLQQQEDIAEETQMCIFFARVSKNKFRRTHRQGEWVVCVLASCDLSKDVAQLQLEQS